VVGLGRQLDDAVLLPAWAPYSARSLSAPAYQLDVFSPPRKAMLYLIELRKSEA
jgi:hypothetical protein